MKLICLLDLLSCFRICFICDQWLCLDCWKVKMWIYVIFGLETDMSLMDILCWTEESYTIPIIEEKTTTQDATPKDVQQQDDLLEKPTVAVTKPKYRSNLLLLYGCAYSLLWILLYISRVLLLLYLFHTSFDICYMLLKINFSQMLNLLDEVHEWFAV